MEHVCNERGLKQHVKSHARSRHLLDLVLSNFASGVRCRIISGICDDDHDGVLATVGVSMSSTRAVRRQVYDFRSADWPKLHDLLNEIPWGSEIGIRSSDAAAAAWVTAAVLSRVEQCIPTTWITNKSYAHLCINLAC